MADHSVQGADCALVLGGLAVVQAGLGAGLWQEFSIEGANLPKGQSDPAPVCDGILYDCQDLLHLRLSPCSNTHSISARPRSRRNACGAKAAETKSRAQAPLINTARPRSSAACDYPQVDPCPIVRPHVFCQRRAYDGSGCILIAWRQCR